VLFRSRDPARQFLNVFTMNADGANVRQITFGDPDDQVPSWSPDGRQIAFASDRATPGQQFDVYVVRRDGSRPTRLTYAEGGSPAWSPDGLKIAFGSNRLGNSNVFTMRADGSRQRPRTAFTDTHEGQADWQPLPGGRSAEEDDD